MKSEYYIINLPSLTYSVFCFDPVNGGALKATSQNKIVGENWMNVSMAPKEDGRDWVLLLKAV